jgi:response regulator of citrate/malate metabolism
MIRVLVVDDDVRVAANHRKLVEALQGFEVAGVAHDADTALALVDQVRPDLLLLDIYLPDDSGVRVLQRLRGSARAVDVLVITAARDVDTVQACIQAGAVQYLLKPFPFSSLRERLERYAAAKNKLASVREAEQSDVDRVYAMLRTDDVTSLPKGLSRTTAQLVAETLRAAGTDLSAAEVAERAGLARVSARRYLDFLTTVGKAEVQMKYGTAGRPQHRYIWIPTGRSPR